MKFVVENKYHATGLLVGKFAYIMESVKGKSMFWLSAMKCQIVRRKRGEAKASIYIFNCLAIAKALSKMPENICHT